VFEASDAPVVVNVSSGLGSLAACADPSRVEFQVTALDYNSSKTALVMVTSLTLPCELLLDVAAQRYCVCRRPLPIQASRPRHAVAHRHMTRTVQVEEGVALPVDCRDRIGCVPAIHADCRQPLI